VIRAEYEAADPDDPDEDGEEAEGYFLDLLEERLEHLRQDDNFGLEPLDEHVVALCAALRLDLSLARRWRDLPDPEGDPEPEADGPGAWRGSG